MKTTWSIDFSLAIRPMASPTFFAASTLPVPPSPAPSDLGSRPSRGSCPTGRPAARRCASRLDRERHALAASEPVWAAPCAPATFGAWCSGSLHYAPAHRPCGGCARRRSGHPALVGLRRPEARTSAANWPTACLSARWRPSCSGRPRPSPRDRHLDGREKPRRRFRPCPSRRRDSRRPRSRGASRTLGDTTVVQPARARGHGSSSRAWSRGARTRANPLVLHFDPSRDLAVEFALGPCRNFVVREVDGPGGIEIGRLPTRDMLPDSQITSPPTFWSARRDRR